MKKRILMSMASSLVSFFISGKTVFGAWDPNDTSGYGLPDASLYEIITNILDWLLTIIGVVGVIAFALAGIMYLTSTGDQKKIDTAKSYMQSAIIGVIVAICGVVVLRAVDTMLNAGYLF